MLSDETPVDWMPAGHSKITFKGLGVLSTRWFTPRDAEDIVFKVEGNCLDYPSLCIVATIEGAAFRMRTA